MQDEPYQEELAADPAVASAATPGEHPKPTFGPADDRSLSSKKSSSSSHLRRSPRRHKRAYFAAALAGFVAGFYAVHVGWLELKELMDAIEREAQKYHPQLFLPEDAPSPRPLPRPPRKKKSPQQRPLQQPVPQQPPQYQQPWAIQQQQQQLLLLLQHQQQQQQQLQQQQQQQQQQQVLQQSHDEPQKQDPQDGPATDLGGEAAALTEEAVVSIVDDMHSSVSAFVTKLKSISGVARSHFASKYIFIPDGTQKEVTVFEHFARLINSVRAVAPPPGAGPKLVTAHKYRVAFLLALLDAASERLGGVEHRLGIMKNFGSISSPLSGAVEASQQATQDVEQVSQDTQLPTGPEMAEQKGSRVSGREDEDEAPLSYFLERISRHVGGMGKHIDAAKKKEAKKKKKKKKKHRDVTIAEAELLADFLCATQDQMLEDKKLFSSLVMKFKEKAGLTKELKECGGAEKAVDGQSRYKVTGASGVAWHLARRAQTDADSVLLEFGRFLIDLGADLCTERTCNHHHPAYATQLEDSWTGEKVATLLGDITIEEQQGQEKAQEKKLSALRTTEDVLDQCSSKAGRVDVQLMQAAIALL